MHAPRGFGFMLSKHMIIQALIRRPETAGVVYADVRCKVNVTESSSNASSAGSTRRTARVTGFVEGEWSERMCTKSDLLGQVPLAADALDGRQIRSGVFILAKPQTSRHLVDEWGTLAQLENHAFPDESGSETSTEDAQFVEHRHDQAIFTSLAKSHGWQPVDSEMHFGPDRWGTTGAADPIWTVRNRPLLSERSPRWLRSIESLGARAWARKR